MRANGLALGGNLENAVVFEGDRVLSPGGLRHADEPVRHKMLDALGDLALAGGPILGRYTGHSRRSCHDQPPAARAFCPPRCVGPMLTVVCQPAASCPESVFSLGYPSSLPELPEMRERHFAPRIFLC